MSTSLFWYPTPKHRSFQLSTMAPDSFMESLQTAFHERPPMTLGQDELSVLVGMAAASKPNHKPYEELIAAIEKHGDIQITVEY